MLLFYMDESGTGLGDEQSPFFLLAAVAIPADQWQAMDRQVASLKRRLVSWAKPEDFEIKGRDMRRGDKLFKNQDWATRLDAMRNIAGLIAELPCKILGVQVDKRDLPAYIGSDSDLYRLAFWRLLEEVEKELDQAQQSGMLMVDMRSDMHSSVQDRRLIDAYREWIGSRNGQTHLIELPWFGYSAFYAGLQIADFSAYVLDFVTNENTANRRNDDLEEVGAILRSRVDLVRIP